MNTWDVYKWTAKPPTAEWIGTVEGRHQPAARMAAAARWPELAAAQWPTYKSGRLIVRPEGDTRGIPCKIIRPGGQS